jgi:hypothetical protein
MGFPTDKKDPQDKGRTQKEVGSDIQNANFDKDPEEPKKEEAAPGAKPATKGVITATPTVPAPGPKTPADMKNDPKAYLPDDQATGD